MDKNSLHTMCILLLAIFRIIQLFLSHILCKLEFTYKIYMIYSLGLASCILENHHFAITHEHTYTLNNKNESLNGSKEFNSNSLIVSSLVLHLCYFSFAYVCIP